MPPSEKDIRQHEEDAALDRLDRSLADGGVLGDSESGAVPDSDAGLVGGAQVKAPAKVAWRRFMDRLKRRFTWLAILLGLLLGLIIPNLWRLK